MDYGIENEKLEIWVNWAIAFWGTDLPRIVYDTELDLRAEACGQNSSSPGGGGGLYGCRK